MNETKAIAKINNISIMVIDNGQKLIPIKPICEALGIDDKTQRDKISNDEILSSVGGLSPSTGADKKQYEMFCLPLKFTFGWLFTINPKNVNPEAREALTRYKLECYEALYRHFTDHTEFLEQKQLALQQKLDLVEEIKSDFNQAKNKLEDAKKELNEVKELTFDTWLANNRQLKINFDQN